MDRDLILALMAMSGVLFFGIIATAIAITDASKRIANAIRESRKLEV